MKGLLDLPLPIYQLIGDHLSSYDDYLSLRLVSRQIHHAFNIYPRRKALDFHYNGIELFWRGMCTRGRILNGRLITIRVGVKKLEMNVAYLQSMLETHPTKKWPFHPFSYYTSNELFAILSEVEKCLKYK